MRQDLCKSCKYYHKNNNNNNKVKPKYRKWCMKYGKESNKAIGKCIMDMRDKCRRIANSPIDLPLLKVDI